VNKDSSFRHAAPDNAVTKSEVAIQLEHGTLTILAEIEGMSKKLILDTGSDVSILQLGVSRGDVSHQYGAARSDWRRPRNQGTPVSFLRAKRAEFENPFLVCTLPSQAAGLIGTDFMPSVGAVTDFELDPKCLVYTPSYLQRTSHSPFSPEGKMAAALWSGNGRLSA
jgi:hypothetical protein